MVKLLEKNYRVAPTCLPICKIGIENITEILLIWNNLHDASDSIFKAIGLHSSSENAALIRVEHTDCKRDTFIASFE